MSGCIPCTASKHSVLINNCYPPIKEGGTIPRSSELSYLTFYASSKPAKLTKVGSYLQKKVEKDIRKGRKSHNLVSLSIIKALIQTCHRDLNIFSKYVIRILNMLLDTRDLDIIDLTCETFIVFGSYHDGSTLGVDLDFTTKYEALLKKFASFCNYSNEDSVFCLKMQYIGQRGVQAAAISNALQASNFKTQVNILFPPLITTLATSENANKAALSSDGRTIDIRDSAINTHDINPTVVDLIATHSIHLLFSRLTGPLVRGSITPLFQYLDENKKWSSAQLPVNIVKLALESIQPQYRYLLVSDILVQLDQVEKEENTMMNDKHATLTSILESILTARITLAGISVLEILNSLFNHLMKTTQHHPFLTSAPDNGAHKIQQNLIQSMGGLASQLYYDNQFNDMVGYLISKLRVNTSLEYVDGMLLYDYRVIVFQCLMSVVRGLNKALPSDSSEAEVKYAGLRISLDTWVPSFGLLHDSNAKTRIQYSQCLYGFLSILPAAPTTDYPRRVMKDSNDFEFMHQLTQSFYKWVLLPDFNMRDLKLLYAFMCTLNRGFGIDATTALVPFAFQLQQLVEENKIELSVRRDAVESALIAWFTMTAHFYHIEPLVEYMESLKRKDILFTETIEPTDTIEEFDIKTDIEDRKEWIDRGTVVELMSNYGNLRDESDPHGLNLEAKLFAEWGSEAYMKNDYIHNIQQDQCEIIQDTKEKMPRLASPWEHTVARKPISIEDRKNSVHVDQLKEALAGQITAEDDGDTSSSQSNLSLPNIAPVPMKSNNINTLLNELSVNQHASSTLSLVNGPYKSL